MIKEFRLGGDHYALHLQLSSPKSLNALNHEMCLALESALLSAATDTNCLGVFIDGEGDRAFCAGGDVRAIATLSEGEVEADRLARADAFFTDEYRLDLLIHQFPKPILIWGSGIVMGGGMGLLQGASMRVVTDSTRMAMPETAIGFFPDVGGSYFLNRVPENLGKVLAVSGMHINGQDAVDLNLADRLLGDDSKAEVIRQITDQLLTGALDFTRVVDSLETPKLEAQVMTRRDIWKNLVLTEAPKALFDQLVALSDSEDAFLQQVAKTTAKGSPYAIEKTLAHLEATAGLSVAECFDRDLDLAKVFMREGEFVEGVRAVLIDRDGAPNWRQKQFREISA